MLRNSERGLFKRCQWAWERAYVDRLRNQTKFSVALWFGTGIHLALEKYYIPGTKRGANPIETWIQYCNKTMAEASFINTYEEGDFAEAVPAKELGILMLENYLRHYGQDEHMDVIATELPFQVGIPYTNWTEDGQKTAIDQFVGTIDLIYRDKRDNKIYLLDHKTAKALGSQNTQFLPLDDQAGAYCAVATHVLRRKELIGQKEEVSGIVYNYLVKRKPDERPRNAEGYYCNKPQKKHYVAQLTGEGLDKLKIAELESLAEEQGVTVLGDISKTQPAPLLDRVFVKKTPRQRRKQAERISQDMQAMSLVKNGLLEATKTPTRECGFCEFREICELNEAGRDYKEMAEIVYTTWEPYSAHEIQKED